MTFTDNGEEDDLRKRLTAPAHNTEQDLYVSEDLPTGRVMVKDEDCACTAGCAPSAVRPAHGTCRSSSRQRHSNDAAERAV